MEIKTINADLTVSDQLQVEDLEALAARGVRSIICNRPDREAEGQPEFQALERRARELGMEIHHLPVIHDNINAEDVGRFASAWESTARPVHAFCRTGLRAVTLWSMMEIRNGRPVDEVVGMAGAAGYDFSRFRDKFAHVLDAIAPAGVVPPRRESHAYQVVIVGAGAAGISVAASLLDRSPGLHIAIIDPADRHYYQPGFTLIGGGVFTPQQTVREMAGLIPEQVAWIKAAVVQFEPEEERVILDNGAQVSYDSLVVCPGLKLDWQAVEGLAETLGRNGVTSNYHPDQAAYTWELVRGLKSGKALFTQPPMPIKCAGAPQKALYLSCDHWRRSGVLQHIDAHFYNAGAVLFGVKEFVPALQSYVERYGVEVHYSHNLVKVDGAAKTAWFETKDADGNPRRMESGFDILHVCPPQTAPDFVRGSPLADAAGWVDVDQATLRHKRYANVWSLGDVCNAPNAKTAAAVRKQAPVVAANLTAELQGHPADYVYEGYGACPLTVERGKVVLAEFGYGGVLQPTLPRWLIEPTQPSRLAWQLKEKFMPRLYWDGMLKGRELMVKPHQALPAVTE